MTNGQVGDWYWHVHHDTLCEQLTEPIEVRIMYIKIYKPNHEIETRLRLMQPIRGELPAALHRARAAALPELEALHAIECPNCPWDGHTIFPEGVTNAS